MSRLITSPGLIDLLPDLAFVVPRRLRFANDLEQVAESLGVDSDKLKVLMYTHEPAGVPVQPQHQPSPWGRMAARIANAQLCPLLRCAPHSDIQPFDVLAAP